MLELTDPDAYFNDIPVNFSRVLFDIMNAMYDEVEPMQFIIGLSMRDPANDQNVLDLAKDARALLGDRLDAMLLGNVRYIHFTTRFTDFETRNRICTPDMARGQTTT